MKYICVKGVLTIALAFTLLKLRLRANFIVFIFKLIKTSASTFRNRWIRRLLIQDRDSERLLSEYRRLSNTLKTAVRQFRATRIDNLHARAEEYMQNTLPNSGG